MQVLQAVTLTEVSSVATLLASLSSTITLVGSAFASTCRAEGTRASTVKVIVTVVASPASRSPVQVSTPLVGTQAKPCDARPDWSVTPAGGMAVRMTTA
jgi:hypothetical protein